MAQFGKRQAISSLPPPWPSASQKPPADGGTRTAQVYQALQADIVEGRRQPGEKLGMHRLCELYAVGLSPLREALSRLLTEGLVTLEGHRGFSVAVVTEAGIRDLARVRTMVECAAFSDAIAHGDDIWEAGVVGAFHRLARVTERVLATPGEGPDAWEGPHREFHAALAAACPSPLLLSLREGLDRRARFHRLAVVNLVPGGRDHLAEHRALMEAALARDAARATALLAEHLLLTTEAICASLSRRAVA